jgi:Domain of unknown function (DUF5753)
LDRPTAPQPARTRDHGVRRSTRNVPSLRYGSPSVAPLWLPSPFDSASARKTCRCPSPPSSASPSSGDQPGVYLEYPAGGAWVDDEQDVERFTSMYDDITQLAHSPADSTDLIHERMKQLADR